MRLGINGNPWHTAHGFACQRIEPSDLFDLVIKQVNTNRQLLRLCRVDIQKLTAQTISTTAKIQLVAGILHLDQTFDGRGTIDLVTDHNVQ